MRLTMAGETGAGNIPSIFAAREAVERPAAQRVVHRAIIGYFGSMLPLTRRTPLVVRSGHTDRVVDQVADQFAQLVRRLARARLRRADSVWIGRRRAERIDDLAHDGGDVDRFTSLQRDRIQTRQSKSLPISAHRSPSIVMDSDALREHIL